ncbi:MAG: ABC transporter ATP-binding protein [Gemmatimonadota bacterium]
MESTTIVRTDQVTKTYRKDGGVPVHALRGVSVTIGAGEFVAFMGASGSGKSTLMNVMGCLDRPSAGTVSLSGEPVHDLDDEALARVRNQKIGFIFQSFHLLPRTSALENVELPLIYSDRRDIRGLAQAALAQVGLADRMQHEPGELSGGQQQRVAIARAMVNDPELILADEPTGNLDTRSAHEIMALFQSLHRRGRTLVMVSHDRSIAEYATRIITLSDGKVTSDEPSSDSRDALVELEGLERRAEGQS